MKRRRVAVVGLAVGSVAFATYLAACGGDDSTPLNGVDGGEDATADGSGFDSTTGDTGTKDTGAQDTGVVDSGLDATLLNDAGNFTDSGPGGDAAVLSCGRAACNLPAQECCLYDTAGDFTGGCANGAGGCPTVIDAGFDAGDASTQLVALGCEVPANCPGVGKVCCVTRDTNNDAISSQCSLASSCVTSGPQHRAQLCDPALVGVDAGADAGDGGLTGCIASVCSNTNISTWSLPNGYGTCGGESSN